MNTEQVKLSQVKVNAENPRTITKDKFVKLVNSILVFPKMLELRPAVVDNKMKALGGNMRTNALREIAKMTPEQIAERLSGLSDYAEKSTGEQSKLIEWWGKWLENPFAYIIKATELTEEERKQFIIKDNVSFGQWDYDALANQFDSKKLDDWAMDVWVTPPMAQVFPDATTSTSSSSDIPAPPSASEDDGEGSLSNLPQELQGLDLNPDDLPKIQGDDDTAMERIIISYPRERLYDVLALLGMEKIDKVVYRLEEIIGEPEEDIEE